MNQMLVVMGASLVFCYLCACGADPDETSEIACENASCPVGTTMQMEATSSSGCEAGASVNVMTESGEVDGKCFTQGSCSYVCVPPNRCCGGEAWTQTSYSCELPCCLDGNPPPCETACGDGFCEYGENPDDCPQDCDTACGNNICEGGEDPNNCAEDCVWGGIFQVQPAILNFGSYGNNLSFSILNKTESTLQWEASETEPWLHIGPTEGSVSSQPSLVSVEVDRSGLDFKTYNTSIVVTATGGYTRVLQIWMNVPDPSKPADNECAPGCRAGFFCLGGACVTECNPPCPAEAECVNGECKSSEVTTECESNCSEEGAEICVTSSNFATCQVSSGCLAWSSSEPCPKGEICVSGGCSKPTNCTPTCSTIGERQCTSQTAYKVCEMIAGCPLWSNSYECGYGHVCDDGFCLNVASKVDLIQPADGDYLTDATPFFDWTDVAGASLYHFQLSSDSGYSEAVIDDKRQSTSLTPTEPLEPGKYYWHVRAATNDSWTDWSDSWSLNITE